MKIFGREYTRDELCQRVGDLSQVAGIKPYILQDGRAKGVDAVDVKTGSGLQFTVLPGRAMDIAWMEYCGHPIGFISKAGIAHSHFYHPSGVEWLRSYYGGVLTTCGITHVGPPEREGDWELGLHGRISNIPAAETIYHTEWEQDELVMTVKGKMREAAIFNENLLLTRSITAYAGSNKVQIRDEVENQGYQNAPFMILYHFNLGFPLVCPESSLTAPIMDTQARDQEAQKGIHCFNRFEDPNFEYREQVFFHKTGADREGKTCVGLVNEPLGLGFVIRYNREQLPCLTEWKMMGQQDYVVGLEPGNCHPIGRNAAREKGGLQMLAPGEKRIMELELEVLAGLLEIEKYKDEVRDLLKK